MNSLRWNRATVARWRTALIVLATLLAAVYVGQRPSRMFLVLPIVAAGGALLLWKPAYGLLLLVVAALALPLEFGTGTEVALNPAALLIPGLVALWMVDMLRRRAWQIAPSRVNKPLFLFLLAGLLSLLVGNALWDPAVPRPGNMTLVQLAQWAILAFSASAFWLTGNLVGDERTLRRLTWTLLWVGGGLAILRVLPSIGRVIAQNTTGALDRSPFWALLAAVGGGQLLFDHELSGRRRAYLLLVLSAVLYYAFVDQRQTASNWVGVAAAAGVLFWLRFPRARRPLVVAVLVLAPFLFPTLYEFGGGEAEWQESGGSRLVLIGRVLQVTMRNPITGLGPASYRPYAGMEPLAYEGAFWVNPQINSHNNYVDLFAHGGLLGLGLLGWFFGELGGLGRRLARRFETGFVAGYVRGMQALLVAALVLMMFADWILPFVYNIGFSGFQASVLVWLFLGGLVAVER
ncbi:MAG: O-antigen ligase family protein [Chloroflexi bacterium]|nr:O-antigen ligase family protein [Chloroflexota bacterium]